MSSNHTDLNHIQLSSSLVADLYQSSLVENEKSSQSQTKESLEKNDLKFLGNNEKNILVFVNYPGNIHLPDEQLSFLTSMLAACKITLADIVLLNRNNYPGADYKNLINEFKSKTVFLFGIEPASFGLPVSFPHFQIQSFINCTFLFTPTLEELENDKVLKSKLWVCLRRIFGI